MKDVGRDLLDVGWAEGPLGSAYLLGALKRQLRVLAAVPAGFLIAGVLYLIVVQPLYTATATLEVRMDDPARADALRQLAGLGRAGVSPLDTHIELLQSDGIASRVVAELGLQDELGGGPGRLTRTISAVRRGLGLDPMEAGEGLDAEAALARALQADLRVERLGATSIIAVSYTAPQRRLAVDVANAVVSAYLAEVSSSADRVVERRVDALQVRIDEVRGLTAAAEAEAQRLMGGNEFLLGSAQDLQARIAELRSQLSAVATDEAEVRARLASLGGQGDDLAALETAALQTPETLRIYGELTAATTRLRNLQEQAAVPAETISQLEQSISEMRASLDRELRRLRSDLDLQLSGLAARRESLEGELEAIVAFSRSPAWTELLEAQQRAAVYEEIYLGYLSELENVKLGALQEDIVAGAEAQPPVEPSFPNYKILLVLAVAAGLLAGAGAAAWREWRAFQGRTSARRMDLGGRRAL